MEGKANVRPNKNTDNKLKWKAMRRKEWWYDRWETQNDGTTKEYEKKWEEKQWEWNEYERENKRKEKYRKWNNDDMNEMTIH